MMAPESERAITHDEAMEAAHALIDHFFKNVTTRRPQARIPAEPTDTDVLLTTYIRQQKEKDAPPCPLNESNRTQFETCSEVVERLPECEEKLRGDKCIRFAGHPDKHQDRYGMQWAPYVRPADIREILRSIFELTARPENRASWVKGTLQERMDKIRELCIKAERKSDSWRERRVQELEEALRRYEPNPDFSQKELVQWHHTRMHEVVNRAYRVFCDTKTVFPKGLARWMGVNTEDDFSKVISEREMRKKLEQEIADRGLQDAKEK